MRRRLLLFITISIGLLYSCQNIPQVDCPEIDYLNPDTAYDSLLAAELGADDYGMKLYVMAFLKRGPNRSQDSTTAAELQSAHMANIGRLAEEGKLVMAGPYGGDGDLRGMYLFDVRTVEEARKLTETDPAIQAGSLEMDLVPWYGSAIVPLVNSWYKKVAKVEM